jgi:ABC-2 type transport system ATP-binding protein
VRQVQAEVSRVRLAFEREAIAAPELVAWLGSCYALRDVTFQEPEIEDMIRRIYDNGLLL